MEVNLARFGRVLVKVGLAALALGVAQTLFWPNAPDLVQTAMNFVFFFGVVTGLMPTMARLLSRHWPRW